MDMNHVFDLQRKELLKLCRAVRATCKITFPHAMSQFIHLTLIIQTIYNFFGEKFGITAELRSF